MSSAPPLSVVVVPLLGHRSVSELLSELQRLSSLPPGSEVIVVSEDESPVEGGRLLVAPRGSTVPERRAIGLKAARGEVIALIEDTVRPKTGWAASLVECHRRFHDAAGIGGTLTLAEGLGTAAIALAALDYGPFLRRGVVSESSPRIPGNNMSFKRSALERASAFEERGFREAEVVGSFGGEGSVRIESEVAAACVGVDPAGASLRSRFNHGRLYAGSRFRGPRRAERLVRAATTPLLAATLVVRAARALDASGSRWVPCLPHLAWMSAAWSLGESVGYLLGPGRAEEAWR
jgi:hypothetical protein